MKNVVWPWRLENRWAILVGLVFLLGVTVITASPFMGILTYFAIGGVVARCFLLTQAVVSQYPLSEDDKAEIGFLTVSCILLWLPGLPLVGLIALFGHLFSKGIA